MFENADTEEVYFIKAKTELPGDPWAYVPIKFENNSLP
jgi:hypothetical protein